MNSILLADLEEELYTPNEVAKLLRTSLSWVYRTFRNYPGVVWLGEPKLNKCSYLTLRIPESVLQRWIREHTAPDPPENISLPVRKL